MNYQSASVGGGGLPVGVGATVVAGGGGSTELDFIEDGDFPSTLTRIPQIPSSIQHQQLPNGSPIPLPLQGQPISLQHQQHDLNLDPSFTSHSPSIKRSPLNNTNAKPSKPTKVSTPRVSQPRKKVTSATGKGRGRPKGRGKSMGFSNKRRRGESSDSEDLDLDQDGEGETDSEEDKRKAKDDDSEDDDDADFEVKKRDMGEEMPDDFNPADDPARKGPTTKFGRKISKPIPFNPSTRSAPPRKKKIINPESLLMCQVCKEGHSPIANKVVICEACEQGWHQLCHDPNITEEHIDTDLSWLCKQCDEKLALSKPPVDVGNGEWVVGNDGTTAYTVEEKKEWLEGLPLSSLIGYIFSLEKKYTPASEQGLAIWPPALPKLLEDNRARKVVEAEERRIKEEALEAAILAEIEREERESKLARDAIVKAKALEKEQAGLARTVASNRQLEKQAAYQQSSQSQQQRMQQSQSQQSQASSNSRDQSPHSPPASTVSPYIRHAGFVPIPALQQQQQQQQQQLQQQQQQYQAQQHQLRQQQQYQQLQQQQQQQGGGGSYSSSPYPISNSRPGSAYDNRGPPPLSSNSQYLQQQSHPNPHHQPQQVPYGIAPTPNASHLNADELQNMNMLFGWGAGGNGGGGGSNTGSNGDGRPNSTGSGR